MNQVLREQILTPYLASKDYGDIRYFHDLPLNVLERLIAEHFVELDEWNECPGVGKAFLPFMKRHPTFKAFGYAVSPEREDARITIEGVEQFGDLTKDEVIDFVMTFGRADEIQITENYARCWYD
jgi:hypothetical protein